MKPRGLKSVMYLDDGKYSAVNGKEGAEGLERGFSKNLLLYGMVNRVVTRELTSLGT